MSFLENFFKNTDQVKPLFTIKGKKELGKWVQAAFRQLLKENEKFNQEVKENLKMYKGDVLAQNKTSSNDRLNNESFTLEKAREAKIYVNKIYNLTEFWVNKLTIAKANVIVGPANTEHEDRIAAKVAKALLDSLWYEHNMDKIDRDFEKYISIAGEHYVAVLWNPDKGEVHPDMKAAEENEEKVYMIGPDGEPVEDEEGNLHEINEKVRIGDVEYKHLPAWRVLPEAKQRWEDVNYIMYWEAVDCDELKFDHPKHKNNISSLSLEYLEGFSEDYLQKLKKENKTLKITIWHKKCKYLPDGREIVATADGLILSDKPLPYNHDDLPVVRCTGIDTLGEMRGVSWYSIIKALQYQHFFLSSMVMANQKVFCYPKYVIQQGTVSVNQLTNERSIIEVRGAKDPYILQPNPTSPEVFTHIEKLERDMNETIMGQFANTEGLPARVDSASAIQFLFEQDNQRFNGAVAKRNQRLIDIAKMTLSVAGQFYDKSDKRLVKIIGKNQEPDIKYFDFANFNRPYDIRLEANSGMPETKSAKISTIMELVQLRPTLFTDQQIMDMLDLGSTDKMFDTATKAIKSAESIIQDIMADRPVPPPEGYEDLMTYWTVFASEVQDRTFKDQTPPDKKQLILDYLGAIEMLMTEKAAINPAFQQRLMTVEMFPLVYSPPPPVPVPTPEEEAMAMDAELNAEETLAAADLASKVMSEGQ